MPSVHIHMFEGRTIEQKRNLVKEVTDAIVKTVDCRRDAVSITIHDMSRNDCASGGVLYSDKK